MMKQREWPKLSLMEGQYCACAHLGHLLLRNTIITKFSLDGAFSRCDQKVLSVVCFVRFIELKSFSVVHLI